MGLNSRLLHAASENLTEVIDALLSDEGGPGSPGQVRILERARSVLRDLIVDANGETADA